MSVRLITHLKQILFSQDLKEKCRLSPRDFTRDRKLLFPQLVLFLANLLKGSLQVELDHFFQRLFSWEIAKPWVSRSALCQARKKISHRVFILLRDAICHFLDREATLTRFHGFRVLAVDGSTLRLPEREALRADFGTHRTKGVHHVMARISILHDVLNAIIYDAIIAPFSYGEHLLAWDHLDTAALPERSLILMDRGYIDFKLLRHLHDEGHPFCVRARSNLKLVRAFRATGAAQAWAQWAPSAQVRAQTTRGSSLRRPLPVRLVRYTRAGRDFFLITTLLDATQVPHADLAALYHQRWQVEEAYKVIKCRANLDAVSGLSPEAVRQDFHAKIFTATLTAALARDCQERLDAYELATGPTYRINMTQALAHIKHTLALLFLRPSRKLRALMADFKNVLMAGLTAVIPGRSVPRKPSHRAVKAPISSMGYKLNP